LGAQKGGKRTGKFRVDIRNRKAYPVPTLNKKASREEKENEKGTKGEEIL